MTWFPFGIRYDAATEACSTAGIGAVQNRCAKLDHRRVA